jgi:hypothetical protein
MDDGMEHLHPSPDSSLAESKRLTQGRKKLISFKDGSTQSAPLIISH